ncbi:hypothetical protein [Halochromatium glycolicum]|jgi:hypothetical protein|uniref:Uncharacterized protein n=1 Tax=Halochromatium glycolicum TaxID=85075 RepID=A0AAJ0XCG0_9GAMM|nr:hypothetical protein [Halochromatium glycolicum]MBK1706837.1 hypothetical protein [Halochromatium glycolicum]
MRILIYLPVIHTAEDLGGLTGAVAEVAADRVTATAAGRGAGDAAQQKRAQGEAARQERIKQVWDQIEKVITALPVGSSGWRLYQDGLPICGREAAIVDELAAGGSRNHQLLQQLIGHGAELMGTEPPDLLVEEYLLQKEKLNASGPEQSTLLMASVDLLNRRDAAIGERINQTLQDGEVGILFIGLLHDVETYLNPDIKLRYPIGKPGAIRSHVTLK